MLVSVLVVGAVEPATQLVMVYVWMVSVINEADSMHLFSFVSWVTQVLCGFSRFHSSSLDVNYVS